MLNINKVKVYHLAGGATDLRKSVDGLTAIVKGQYKLDPLQNELFLFCNRDRNKLKILHWEHNGFWLYYRRLETGKFKWPGENEKISTVNRREIEWVLSGLSFIQYQEKHEEVVAIVSY